MKKETGLSIIASAGVIGTAVATGFATKKAIERIEAVQKNSTEPLTKSDIFKTVATVYIAPVLLGGSTIFCIFSANTLNQRKQAALTSAYALSQQMYKEYREKLIELHGDEMDREIRNCVSEDHVIRSHAPNSGQKNRYYIMATGQYIERTEQEIVDAEYSLNRTFIMEGTVSVGDLCEYLGVPVTKEARESGWTSDDGYLWIDFEHHLTHDGDGDYYAIETVIPPYTELFC